MTSGTMIPAISAAARSTLHGQRHLAERRRQAELAGVEDAVRVERVLHRLQHVEAGAERLAHEPAAVEADAVVVAERAAVREHRARARRPTRRGSTASRSSSRRPAREREVEAGAVGVRVALVRRRGQRVLAPPRIAAVAALVDRRAASRHGAGDLHRVDDEAARGSAPRARDTSLRCSSHCSTSATSSGSRRPRTPRRRSRMRRVDERRRRPRRARAARGASPVW